MMSQLVPLSALLRVPSERTQLKLMSRQVRQVITSPVIEIPDHLFVPSSIVMMGFSLNLDSLFQLLVPEVSFNVLHV